MEENPIGSEETDQSNKMFSLEELYQRISTFTDPLRPLNWLSKPVDISPLVCGQHGWTCSDMDTLSCANCGALLTVRHDSSMDFDAGFLDDFTVRLKTKHSTYCPWSVRSSSDQLFSVPSQNKERLLEEAFSRLHSLIKAEVGDQMEQVQLHHQLESSDIKEFLQQYAAAEIGQLSGVAIPRLAVLALYGWQSNAEAADQRLRETSVKCYRCCAVVGLWNFTRSRPPDRMSDLDKNLSAILGDSYPCYFDVIIEHQIWCPWRLLAQPLETDQQPTQPWQAAMQTLFDRPFAYTPHPSAGTAQKEETPIPSAPANLTTGQESAVAADNAQLSSTTSDANVLTIPVLQRARNARVAMR